MIDLSTWKKAWALLDKREQRNAWVVLGVMILSAVSTAAMVGSVMPFLTVLAEPKRIETTPILAWAYNRAGFTSTYTFLVALGFASFSVIVLSNIIQVLRAWIVARYAMMRIDSISRRLLETYLAQPYSFYITRHSGEMAPRVLQEPSNVVNQFLRPAVDFVAALLTTAFVVGFLVWIEPFVAVIAIVVFGSIYGVVYFAARLKIKSFGHSLVEANKVRFRIAHESFSGIKDIKLLGREAAYLDRFSVPSKRMARALTNISVFSQLPQFGVQAIALGGIILLAIVLIDPMAVNSGTSLLHPIPVLGVFAFAGQRLMPELSRVYQSLASMKSAVASVDSVYEDSLIQKPIDFFSRRKTPALGLKEELRLDTISFSYPNSDHVDLQDITLDIRAGEKVGIVGTTGAGKTTLVDVVLGLLEPDNGCLIVDGVKIKSENLQAWMQTVGYVPQDIFLTDAPVAENIALGIHPGEIDYERIYKAAHIARIDRFIRDELPEGYQTHLGERGVRLSGGQRQRIGIARALYHDADLIVLDEATSALDNMTEREVMSAIESLPGDKTVMMIAHRLSTVKRCDRIIVLEKGRVVGFDMWDNLMVDNESFKRIAPSPAATNFD